MNYIYINFIPGSAGNFLSRALGLNDKVYSHSLKDRTFSESDIESKFESYSYKPVLNRTYSDMLTGVWDDFEEELADIQRDHMGYINHFGISEDSNIIILQHPNEYGDRDIAGPDDIEKHILIDVDGNYELAFCNAVYKDGIIRVQYLEGYNDMIRDESIYKFKFIDLFDSDTFISSYKKLCSQLNIVIRDINIVKKLHDEWLTTALQPNQIKEFRKVVKRIRSVAEQSRMLIAKSEDER